MITRIIHISDLHFPSRDESAQQILANEIVEKRPDFLVVTGDLVDTSSWRASKAWIETREWLEDVRERASAGREEKIGVFVLPGNHDVLHTGLIGWCWPPTRAFRRTFAGWCDEPVVYDEAANLTLLTLDTNPRAEWFSAKGIALTRRLRALRQAMDRHEQAQEIRESTKILLMHHHPLPVPFGGSDWLLETRRVDRLLQFVAECQVDLILHGHKHNATWSHLRIGGTSHTQFFVEVLGAGAAFKRSDFDPRGHNYNLIDVAANGIRRVRQFFKPGGAPRFLESPTAGAEERVSRMVLGQFRHPYRFARLTWKVEADAEGDSRNHLHYAGLVFNGERDRYRLPLPSDFLEIGEGSPYRLTHWSPPSAGPQMERSDENGEEWVVFTIPPRDDEPGEVTVENYGLNSHVMNRREARDRGLEDEEREFMEFVLREIVEELNFDLTFPADFGFRHPRLEVLEPIDRADSLHQELTTRFRACVQWEQASPHRIRVSLSAPPPNLRYRLSWELPEASPASGEEPAARARRSRFENFYLKLADRGPAAVGTAAGITEAVDAAATAEIEAGREAIIGLFEQLWNALDAQFSALHVPRFGPEDFAALDVSLLVCERTGQRPQLRLIYWSGETARPEFFRDFRLAIGEGNAGRAYKAGSLRFFDQDMAAKDPKANTFRLLPGGPRFVVLVSIPLLDPVTHLPLAVVNVGTESAAHADSLRALGAAEWQQVTKVLYGEPLTSLLRVANLHEEPADSGI